MISLSRVVCFRPSIHLGSVVIALAVAVAPGSPAIPALHAQRAGAGNDVQARMIEPNVYLVSGRDGNMLVVVGANGPMVIGEPSRALTDRAQQLLVSLHSSPVRYVLITTGDRTGERGDNRWLKQGAICIAHEGIRFGAMKRAQSDPTLRSEVPLIGFSDVLQISIDGGEIHAVHQPGGYSDADVSVHLEKVHTLFLGSLFTTDGYPNIDLEAGGSMDGLIATALKFLGMFGSDPEDVEPIVPGRGPLATMQGLRDYHQMLVTIRSRVDSLLDKGEAVEDVIRAHPTAEFDARWGKGPVAPRQFVVLVYHSLQRTRNK